MLISLLIPPALSAQDAAPDKDAEKAVEEFQKEFNQPDVREDDQIMAVRKVGRVVHSRTLTVLSGLLTRHSCCIRISAAMCLTSFKALPESSRVLIAAYSSPANQGTAMRAVRIRILQTIGANQAEPAVGTVNAAIFDKDVWISRAAIAATAALRHRSSIDALLCRLKQLESREGDRKIPDEDPIPDPKRENTEWKPGDAKDISNKYGEGSGGSKPEKKKLQSERQILRPVVDAAMESITRQKFATHEAWNKWWSGVRKDFKVPQ